MARKTEKGGKFRNVHCRTWNMARKTGNPKINMTLSEKRAKNVVEALKAKGIAADRIITSYKGDTVQPYQKPEENRVCICIAE